MRSVRTFWRLPREDKRLVLRAAATVLAVRATLVVLPFRYWRDEVRQTRPVRGAGGGKSLPAAGADDRREVRRVAWAVSRVSRWVPGATCLTQAIAVRRLLDQIGVASTLRIGVCRDDAGAFRAHAWVEHGGEVVIGGAGAEDVTDFAPLPVR